MSVGFTLAKWHALPYVLALWLILFAAEFGFAEDSNGNSLDGKRRHALLIGCTDYPNLETWFQLRGPANDVLLMRQLLIDRFEYQPDHDDIVLLAASQSDDNKPTHAHIEREFQRLAATVQSGESVVILMAGHGSQQPDNDPKNTADSEPDGLDEIFLPADVNAWGGDMKTVENAIVDDQLRGWLAQIIGRGAFVWLIMDACHSGSGIRGSEAEVSRQVPADQLVPQEVLDAVKTRSDVPLDAPSETSLFNTGGPGGLVAIYAAQPNETTPERKMPIEAEAGERKYYGLLTYTICEILTNAGRGITYNELVQAVQTRYITMGRRAPTPLLEGTHRDNLILGRESFPQRSRTLLERHGPDGLIVTSGSLQELTTGSILAVYAPVGSKDETQGRPLGHVQVLAVDLSWATVRPCEYAGIAVNEKLPHRGRCEVVYQHFGEQQLRVAVDPLDAEGEPISDDIRLKLSRDLRGALEKKNVSLVDDPAEADWLLRWDAGEIHLVPASGIPRSDVAGHETALAPMRPSPGWTETAIQNLERIMRARNLLRLTSLASGSTEAKGLGLEMTIVDAKGEPLVWQAPGLTLNDGDHVTVRLKNSGKQAIDVTLLYVDSAYGITCLYPYLGETNRLGSGDQEQVVLDVNAETTGLESLVAIVVRGERQPVDFSLLEQPSLDTARTRGFDDGALKTPLGQLCRTAMYGVGATRGITRGHDQDYGVNVVSWRIFPR